MVTRITSKDNFVIKRLKQLESRKYRDRLGMFVLEGPSVIEESIRENIGLEFALYSDSFIQNGAAGNIIRGLEGRGVPVYSVEDRMFAAVSGTETPQGILAAARKPEWDSSVLEKPGANFIVLDRVADPGNMGTIIRTSEAAGFEGIVVIKGSADPYSGKVSRAAAGALMRMPVFYAASGKELVDMMKKNGKRTVCTDPRSSVYYYDIDISRDTAIIIGNEASGVSGEIFENADLTAGIPMEGKTESLNAAVASCILMYESLRQRNKQNTAL
ncbi:MAG: RNA methyltransferase [Bacillota bacterium]|nr:RNA methyltransferase [Bacillota bacterium]